MVARQQLHAFMRMRHIERIKSNYVSLYCYLYMSDTTWKSNMTTPPVHVKNHYQILLSMSFIYQTFPVKHPPLNNAPRFLKN